MALPTPPPPPNPIPNNPFFAPLNPYVCGPYFPVALGNGIDLTTGATVPQLVNQVQNVLSAGPGIALTTFLGVTTITSTGGGGGAVPATPLVTGTVFGYTDGTDVDFNTSLGYCALGVGAGASAGFANVAVGICAGCAITTAYGNTLIGPGTGIAIVDGNTNTALGIGALSLTTSGFANVGIGMCSGCAYTTESGNAVFGGYFGDSGDTNTLILADGPGNLKAKFDSLGALSFDGTSYGAIGEVLSSNGPGAKPTWIAGGGASPATPSTFGTVVGLVDSSANAGLGCFVLNSITTGTDNVAIGDNALVANTTGGYNVAVGTYAASYNTTGAYNTAVGHNVFNSNTSGSYNNAFGLGTLGANITGCYNNAFGWGALGVSLSGDSNTAIGNKAMALNNTGSFNTGIGEYSLCSIDSGCYNVGVGHCSGKNISTGCYNVAIGPEVQFASGASSCQLSIGFSAADNWLTGDSTKAIKPGAGILDCAASTGTAGQVLMSNGANAICWGAAGGASAATPTVAGVVLGRTSATNAALGCNALVANTTGTNNTAVGCSAQLSSLTATNNTAIGFSALRANTTGIQNVVIGSCAMLSSEGASNSIAIGHTALQTNTGGNNVAIGCGAMVVSTTSSQTVAIGRASLLVNTTGTNNVSVGYFNMRNNTTGSNNVAVGSCSLNANSTGSGNVMVGGVNETGLFTPPFSPTVENNRVVIGSTATTNAYVQVAWTAVSDARDKTNVTALPVGLDFVNQLNPVSYQFKESREVDVSHGPVRYGFLAQEVLAAEGENPVLVDTEDPEKLKITNDYMNAVLVKAIQELSAKVEVLEAKLAANG